MSAKFRQAVILLLFVLAFIPTRTASADLGPKPTMDFTFEQAASGGQLTILSGILDECEQAGCQDAKPLQQLGPQGFGCDDTTCHALGYGFSPYHRLEIRFSDGKTRASNIFKTDGFYSVYTVSIRPDDLLVQAQFNPQNLVPLNGFPMGQLVLCCACLLVLLVVVIVVVVVVVRRRSKKQ